MNWDRFPRLKRTSEDGKVTGELKFTPFTVQAILTTPTRRQKKRFRSKGRDNEFFARQWIHERIKIYDDYRAERGEFINEPQKTE